MLKTFFKDESGATAIEYGLIAAILAVGIIAAVTVLRDQLRGTFNSISTTMANNASGVNTN